MPKPKRRCDECESLYFSEASQMMSLCPECSHLLYDYPNCQHKFENGSCVNCGWDGSRSEYLKGLLQRHNMSDAELNDELVFLEGRMKKLSRLKEVKALMSEIAPPPLVMVAIGCNWRTLECEGARDGLLDLKVLLNESFVVRGGNT